MQMDPSAVKPAGATTSEGVLANFFNSLLSKKTGGMAGGAAGQPSSMTGLSPGQAGPPPKGGSPQPDDCKYTFSFRVSQYKSAKVWMYQGLKFS